MAVGGRLTREGASVHRKDTKVGQLSVDYGGLVQEWVQKMREKQQKFYFLVSMN